ncbi:hypothetical protein [Amycolatopsis speibonae]|uniref:DUF4254 domain-containing protein n=1 Tax=Amycolatopsis speibonae TaxID=1450224 RepID=A0ABV7P0M3_9PSEU
MEQKGRSGESADGSNEAAIGSCGGNGTGGAPARPAFVMVPGLELAIWLDRCVDKLIKDNPDCGDLRASEQRLDLLTGLCNAADALRASDRCDHEQAERQLRSAVGMLRRIDLEKFSLPVL